MSELALNILKLGNDRQANNPTTAVPLSAYANIITLQCGINSSGSNYHGFQKCNGPTSQAQYQVTVGKKFLVLAAYVSASTNSGFLLGYATATFTENNATVPTGAVYYAGTSSGMSYFSPTTAYQTVPVNHLVGMTFPASSFPFILQKTGSSSNFHCLTLIGMEV
jgi:hypothetical protein